MEEQQESQQNTQQSLYLIPGAIVIAGVLIAGAVLYSNFGDKTTGRAAVGDTVLPDEVVRGNLADDDPVLGNPDAPVTIVEFSDFQCPFCRRLYFQTLPQIKEQYIKTGKVKFVYRDFPLTGIHDLAQKYAEGAECADEQGKFWLMHDKIFDEQERLGQGTIFDYTAEDIKTWARELGLDGAKFDECLDSGKYADEVQRDLSDGQRAGVQGTPGTFVNGRLVSGAVPFGQFQTVIEEELKKAQ